MFNIKLLISSCDCINSCTVAHMLVQYSAYLTMKLWKQTWNHLSEINQFDSCWYLWKVLHMEFFKIDTSAVFSESWKSNRIFFNRITRNSVIYWVNKTNLWKLWYFENDYLRLKMVKDNYYFRLYISKSIKIHNISAKHSSEKTYVTG